VATRFEIERAVLLSDLAPGCRHLAHVLCIRIDAAAGVILPAYQPSLSDLARDSGRDRRTIMRYLNVLEREGWVKRRRPPAALARKEHRRTHYAIGIPQARDSMPPELGALSPAARDSMPPELGTLPSEARDTVPHRSSGHHISSDADLLAIIEAIKERDGATVDRDWAQRVFDQITGARDIRRPGAYARRVIAGAPPGTYRPQASPPKYTREKGFA
jgi:hypothetical protein